MIVSLILLGVFIAVTFALWHEGTWGGLIMLLNVLLAATLATAWYEWVLGFLEPRLAGFTYVLDFVVIWGLFAVVLLVAREAPSEAGAAADVLAETFDVLRSLGHSDADARRLVDALRGEKKKPKDVQEALEAVYRQVHRPR